MPTNQELAQKLKEANEKLKALEESGAYDEDELAKENAELKAKTEALEGELVEVQKSKAQVEKDLTESISKMKVPEIVDGETAGGIKVMTPEAYAKYSNAQGRVMGRPKDVKTECTIEELRALINSNWSPSMVMEKHGMDADDLKQLVWKLSKAELRDKPIKYSIDRDVFGREG